MWTAETVLVCALTLLTRGADSFPPIQFINAPPPGVATLAEGFVRTGDPQIYIITSSFTFRSAQRASEQCGDRQALRKLASVIVHEEWHIKHGRDEAGAYFAQLSTLTYLNAGPGTPLYSQVYMAMRAAVRRQRDESAR